MQFKTLALATTSLVALGLAAATPAAEAKTGMMMGRVDIDFSYYWDDWGNDGGESGYDYTDEYMVLVGSGRVNIPYDEWYNIVVELNGAASLDDTTYPDGQAGYFAGGVHLNYRDPKVGLLGIFAGLGRANASYGTGPTYLAGIEGQYYCDRWTFYAQIGYWDALQESSLLQNAGFVRAEASYYVNQQLKLTAGLKYINGEMPDYYELYYNGYYLGYDSDGWDWLARVDYMFGHTMPIAVFAEYVGRSAETDGYSGYSTDLDMYRFNVGVTFYFGGDNDSDLMYQDRNGAGVNLPDFDEIRAPEPYSNNN